MAAPILMPTFGMTEGEATIVRWLKSVGDRVAADEPLLEAETDKASLEVPSPGAGVLLRIDAGSGQIAAYKTVIGWIGQPGETLDITTKTLSELPSVGEKPSAEVQAPDDGWVKASPLARRIAREHGIDLATLTGTGPHGRVVEADVSVLAARVSASSAVTGPPVIPLTTARRLTAARMTESFRTAPHFYLQKELRAARLVALRAELLPEFERRVGVRLSYTDLFVRALAMVLPHHLLLMAAWTEEGVRTFDHVDVGVAVATAQGLLVPVIRQTESLSLLSIAVQRHDLAQRAREGSLMPAELTGGAITLTNLGMYDVDSFLPILNPPQSAILAAGAIAERPVGVAGRVVLAPTLHLSLAVDHRAADGAQAAQFLSHFVALLESPSPLAL